MPYFMPFTWPGKSLSCAVARYPFVHRSTAVAVMRTTIGPRDGCCSRTATATRHPLSMPVSHCCNNIAYPRTSKSIQIGAPLPSARPSSEPPTEQSSFATGATVPKAVHWSSVTPDDPVSAIWIPATRPTSVRIKLNRSAAKDPFVGLISPLSGFFSAWIYALAYSGHEQKTHQRFCTSRTPHRDRRHSCSSSFAISNLSGFPRNRRITSTANALHTSFLLARTAASRAKSNVTVCSSANAMDDAAACGGTLANGWIVFVDTNRDIVGDAKENVIRGFPAIPEQIILTTNDGANYFSLPPTGLGRRHVNRTALQTALLHSRGSVVAAGGSSAALGRYYSDRPLQCHARSCLDQCSNRRLSLTGRERLTK